jgi:hypothetical protein
MHFNLWDYPYDKCYQVTPNVWLQHAKDNLSLNQISKTKKKQAFTNNFRSQHLQNTNGRKREFLFQVLNLSQLGILLLQISQTTCLQHKTSNLPQFEADYHME